MRRLLMSGVAVAAMVAFGSLAGAQQQQTVQPMPSQSSGASQTQGGTANQTTEEAQPGQTKQQSSEGTTTIKKKKMETQKTGQAEGTTKKKMETQKTGQTESGTDQTTKKKKTQASEETSGATGATSKASKIDVPEGKRSQIAKTFSAHKVSPAKIDVDVSIGVAVPRTVVLHPVPAAIVEIVPAFRHYRYFVLANGEIVIVDPATFVVVYVLTV